MFSNPNKQAKDESRKDAKAGKFCKKFAAKISKARIYKILVFTVKLKI